MKNFKVFGLLFLLSFGGCNQTEPVNSDYSKLLIGTWKQDKVFTLINPNTEPLPKWDWTNPEEGAELILQPGGAFWYNRYEGCFTGSYTFDPEFRTVTYTYDCEVNYFGEMTSIVLESVFLPDNKTMQVNHNLISLECTTACMSFFKKED